MPEYAKKQKQSITEINLSDNDEPKPTVTETDTDMVIDTTAELESTEPIDESKPEISTDGNVSMNIDSAEEEHRKIVAEKISVKISEVGETDYCRKSKRRPINERMLTDKSKERLKFLQREIKSNLLFDDPSKLYLSLVRNERERGLADKVCRKTALRLLTFLCKKKLIRLWRIEFQYKTRFRIFLYITSKEVDMSFPLMKSSLEQAKSKFQLSIVDEENRMDARKIKKDPTKIVSHLNTQRVASSSNQSLNYGLTPKYIRLRTLHEFLFYLSYEHKHTSIEMNQEELAEKVKQNAVIDCSDIEPMPQIWSSDGSWKTFVPPLLKHQGFNEGWVLLSDCIFRMPLSIFVRVVNISYEIRSLDEILVHPIKKHFLLKDLPVQLQRILFSRRKYIASIHDLLLRLCAIGLIQIGPHRATKDQAFYYVNRYAKLYDTSTSEQGLYYITDKEYTDTIYELNSLKNVSIYWNDLHSICMSTKLNRKSLGSGITPAEKVIPERLLAYCKAVQPHEAIELDVGVLPGDKRGAACLDSYFFAHLERNWSFNATRFKQTQYQPFMPKAATKPLRYKMVRVTRDATLKKNQQSLKAVPLHKLKAAVVRRRVPVTRKKKTILFRKRIQNKYDDIDRMAIQNMKKLRVDWSDTEDNFLLLCKVAQKYLNPSNRFVMPAQVIRDLIHWNCKSLNKTALACRRRIAYIIKNLPNSNQIKNSVMMCLSEIKENKSIEKRYGANFIRNLKKIYPNEDDFSNAFRVHFNDLVHTLSCQFYNLTNNFESNPLILPKTISEFNERYIERSDTVYDSNALRYDAPETVDDLKVATIITLIHSTMCCCYDKTSWSIQLYEIYKDFPEKLLSMAMSKVRSDQLISHNKLSSGLRKAHNRCLPLSSCSYHLSATYQQQMNTKISYDLFDETFAIANEILCDENYPYNFNTMNSGSCFFVTELLQTSQYTINIEIPKRILLLDPAKRKSDESFQGICDRFHEIFNYIPKVDLDDTMLDEILSELPNSDDKSASSISKKLESFSLDILHYFCIIDEFGNTKRKKEIELSENGICSLVCIRTNENPFNVIMEKLIAKREIWNRLNVEQQKLEKLPTDITIDETNIVAVYNLLVLKASEASEQQRNENLNNFKQLLDIVDEMLMENDKDFIDEDFGAEYDLRSDMKKKLYDGAQINEKIHKFHDFLCVNTCKLSLAPTAQTPSNIIDFNQLNKKRDDILAEIVR